MTLCRFLFRSIYRHSIVNLLQTPISATTSPIIAVINPNLDSQHATTSAFSITHRELYCCHDTLSCNLFRTTPSIPYCSYDFFFIEEMTTKRLQRKYHLLIEPTFYALCPNPTFHSSQISNSCSSVINVNGEIEKRENRGRER
ncbi:Hypothetical predicted protein [Olea europaea subsp. europaea]|uniref:Uncharacterized protein n=1 Tax=Olea europaea subsp. europaea TaxID=158383 RepID=A0A8S0SMW8_OLEEU|nr:Hypothetical predicted protein [Olea europaea subsp. europaea]